MTLPAARPPAAGVTPRYGGRPAAADLTVGVPDGSFTVIVGPAACGKSALLRAFAGQVRPAAGQVLLDGGRIATLPARQLARRMGLLPQSATAPGGITVADLVARGRYPQQGLLRRWSPEDRRIVCDAMTATSVEALADRSVDELSGGQRQRVWLAVAIARRTPLLLLDEPTAFLDVAHQVEVLDLCARLRREQGRTLVVVLRDLHQAARYATHLIALRDGAVVAEGPPGEIVTADLVRRVFDLPGQVVPDPRTGTPLVVPPAPR
ncbi:iron complex transport system ATP-binding protein [Kitasatospora sp. SolWspMP-SS2h]|uniref:ABC transporter ATP-binding protein n=1 Tax=Kitasatospora sp. SolWspMP-SS2h TaxID=1305729 RepID=UPI000DB91831|nr:ABC transporter ATP-binding protein [Kitasatospora sp. SolWspMP-SS2h]RAJ45586.1 iron complex transport system ATP-binding protein [Kitasatospora sp. SolWspMP-SS2h]